jgi:hypothetical protein
VAPQSLMKRLFLNFHNSAIQMVTSTYYFEFVFFDHFRQDGMRCVQLLQDVFDVVVNGIIQELFLVANCFCLIYDWLDVVDQTIQMAWHLPPSFITTVNASQLLWPITTTRGTFKCSTAYSILTKVTLSITSPTVLITKRSPRP